MWRRDFLKQGAVATSGIAALAQFPSILRASAAEQKMPPKRIVLRSSWQTVNIGDIAHTPGVLALLEKHLPQAEVTLWASGNLTDEVAAMEHRRFPKLKIVKGSIGEDGKIPNPELKEALELCDFLLHGSGPSLVAKQDVQRFVQHIGKPFGVYGITYSSNDPREHELLSQAKFVFFRDSVSLNRAKELGVNAPVMQFAPDGAFACDLRNEEAAHRYMNEVGLQSNQFVCCIPRLRYTPYWWIRQGEKINEEKHARNEEMKVRDHAPLLAAIRQVLAQTDLRVLLAPEDMTQMAVAKELLWDQLTEQERSRVVWRGKYWLTDEALSIYLRSCGLFGLEMHSPIMCIGNGIPAIVGRFSEQTSKGLMWKDIGLEPWLFDFDDEKQKANYADTVIEMLQSKESSAKLVEAAQRLVADKQQESMDVLRNVLNTATS